MAKLLSAFGCLTLKIKSCWDYFHVMDPLGCYWSLRTPPYNLNIFKKYIEFSKKTTYIYIEYILLSHYLLSLLKLLVTTDPHTTEIGYQVRNSLKILFWNFPSGRCGRSQDSKPRPCLQPQLLLVPTAFLFSPFLLSGGKSWWLLLYSY